MNKQLAMKEMDEIMENMNTNFNLPDETINRYLDLSYFIDVCNAFNFFIKLCPAIADEEVLTNFWNNFYRYASKMRHMETLGKVLCKEQYVLLDFARQRNGEAFYNEYRRFLKEFFNLWVSGWNTN